MGHQPIYERIERDLRRRIGSLEEGSRIASETQLAEEFGVSRMTARQAVGILERDGLLERIPGKGTFVRRSTTTRRVARLMSFHDEATSLGKQARSRVLSALIREPTGEELNTLDAHEVVAITRVRCFDDVPIALEEAAFVPALRGLLDIDLEHDSVHAAIRRWGFDPTSGHSVLGARAAGEHAVDLGVTPDTALLVETRTVRDSHRGAIEHTSSCYVPDRYALSVDFIVDGRDGPSAAPEI